MRGTDAPAPALTSSQGQGGRRRRDGVSPGRRQDSWSGPDPGAGDREADAVMVCLQGQQIGGGQNTRGTEMAGLKCHRLWLER